MARPPEGGGYWLLAADGLVFGFGAARLAGSPPSPSPPAPAAAIAGTSGGYWVAFGHDPFGPSVAAFVSGRMDNVTAAVYDVASGELFTFRPGVVEHTASTVKLDILAALLQEAQAADRPLTATEQAETVPMIENSQVLSDASRAYILNLMEHVTPSQDWGASGGVPAGVTVALKNGFSIIDGWQINTEGWVNGLGRDYLVAVLTDDNPSEEYGIQTVDGIAALVWQALAQ